ncbi:MAG: hypothetical protein ACP5O4_03160 [bacterium]
MINYLIGNYKDPIEYKDIYLGLSFKLPYFTNIKHTKIKETNLILLNFNYYAYNNISINYLILSDKIKTNNLKSLENTIKELLEFISYPNLDISQLILLEFNKILNNNNLQDSINKIIKINLNFDLYVSNPFLVIGEKIIDLRYLFRKEFIFKIELGFKILKENELIIYILLSDTFFNDLNKYNWYKEFILNSIKSEKKLSYTIYPIKINTKTIANINLINNQTTPYTFFNLLEYNLYYQIFYPNLNMLLQNGQILLNIMFNNFQGLAYNYLGKNNLNFYYSYIYNLNDALNLFISLIKSFINLQINIENIYNIYLDDLSTYIYRLKNLNLFPLLIIFNDPQKSIKGFIYLYITVTYNAIIYNYYISYYNSNLQNYNNSNYNNLNYDNSNINIFTFDEFLNLNINLINSINYDIMFVFEKMNYIINKEKVALEESRRQSSASREISDIIYNELRKENQHRSNLYNKLRESNQYSSNLFREIQKGFEKDREAFTNAFSAAINNETYAKDPITNEIYRVPAYSGFDNVEYYRDNYNYYSPPEIYQVKSYDYQAKEYLESQGYKKMKTDKFGFVYEEE